MPLTREQRIEQRIKKIKYEYWIKRLSEIKEQKAKLTVEYHALLEQHRAKIAALESERQNIADFNLLLMQPVTFEFLKSVEQFVDLQLEQEQKERDEKLAQKKQLKKLKEKEALEKRLIPDKNGMVKLPGFQGKLKLEEAKWHLEHGSKPRPPQQYLTEISQEEWLEENRKNPNPFWNPGPN